MFPEYKLVTRFDEGALQNPNDTEEAISECFLAVS
jgi:hypothetical protein